jgi:hypothetical protein
MYKIVLIHEVLPGKLAALKAWCSQQDQERKARDAAYTPPKRYITLFGSVHQVMVEAEVETIPEPFLRGYAEHPAEGAQGEFLQLIVPGHSELRVLKELNISSS